MRHLLLILVFGLTACADEAEPGYVLNWMIRAEEGQNRTCLDVRATTVELTFTYADERDQEFAFDCIDGSAFVNVPDGELLEIRAVLRAGDGVVLDQCDDLDHTLGNNLSCEFRVRDAGGGDGVR